MRLDIFRTYRLPFVLTALIVLHLASSPAISQKEPFVKFEVPPSYVSLILFDDPECPLKLSGPEKVIGYSYGALALGYTIANRSNANIKSFDVQQINWFGNIGYSIPADLKPGFAFYPGLDHYMLEGEDVEDLAAFDGSSESTREVLKTSNRYWVAMVVKVRLSDGTVYDASKKFAALEDYVQHNWDYFMDRPYDPRVAKEAYQKDINTKGLEFRDFLEKLAKQKN